MQKIIEYTILEIRIEGARILNYRSNFRKKMEEHIQNGWQPYGSPVVVPPIVKSNNRETSPVYMQAMVKYENPPRFDSILKDNKDYMKEE